MKIYFILIKFLWIEKEALEMCWLGFLMMMMSNASKPKLICMKKTLLCFGKLLTKGQPPPACCVTRRTHPSRTLVTQTARATFLWWSLRTIWVWPFSPCSAASGLWASLPSTFHRRYFQFYTHLSSLETTWQLRALLNNTSSVLNTGGITPRFTGLCCKSFKTKS